MLSWHLAKTENYILKMLPTTSGYHYRNVKGVLDITKLFTN